MKRIIWIHPAAREEFAAAVRWYEEQRPGLGAEFFESVTRATSLIESQQEIGAFDSKTRTRRVLIDRFPYQVVYYVSAKRSLSSLSLIRNADPASGKIEYSPALLQPAMINRVAFSQRLGARRGRLCLFSVAVEEQSTYTRFSRINPCKSAKKSPRIAQVAPRPKFAPFVTCRVLTDPALFFNALNLASFHSAGTISCRPAAPISI